MKWGLPCKIQPFLPKPTGDAEEDPNEVFDTMCSTSVSNVPACHSSDHIMQFTYNQALHAYPWLKCPRPSWAHAWNLSVLGRDRLESVPATQRLSTPNAASWNEESKPAMSKETQALHAGKRLMVLLPTVLPDPTHAVSITKAQLSRGTTASKWQQPHLVISRRGRGRAHCATWSMLSAGADCVSSHCLHAVPRRHTVMPGTPQPADMLLGLTAGVHTHHGCLVCLGWISISWYFSFAFGA